MTTFMKLYGHYKDYWSLEMRMSNANMTYDELWSKTQQDEEWF